MRDVREKCPLGLELIHQPQRIRDRGMRGMSHGAVGHQKNKMSSFCRRASEDGGISLKSVRYAAEAKRKP